MRNTGWRAKRRASMAVMDLRLAEVARGKVVVTIVSLWWGGAGAKG